VFAFLGRRFAVDQIVGQTGSRVLAQLGRIRADVAAPRKKLGRKPLLLVQLARNAARVDRQDRLLLQRGRVAAGRTELPGFEPGSGRIAALRKLARKIARKAGLPAAARGEERPAERDRATPQRSRLPWRRAAG
jgi:hypothetical protein